MGCCSNSKSARAEKISAIQETYRKLREQKQEMEKVFNDLKKDGNNDVDSLVKWMKDSNILGDAKDSDAKVRGLFKESKDQANVDFAKFKEVVGKLAAEQKKNVDEISKLLEKKGPDILKQLQAAAHTAKGVATEAAATATTAVKAAADQAQKAMAKK